MRVFLRALWLFRASWGWMVGGIALSLAATLASVALMAASGWFITAMGAAGIAGASMNYYTPAAIIRAMAMIRTAARYLERLVTHEATFQVLGGLRRMVFDRLEPLAPAGLEDLHGADVAARLTGDVDRLRDVYLRGIAPLVAGGIAGALCVAVAASLNPLVGGLLAVSLLLVGGGGGLVAWLLGQGSGRASVTAAEALRVHAVDYMQGLAELQVFGADQQAREAFLSEARALRTQQSRSQTLEAVARALSAVVGSVLPLLVLVLAASQQLGSELSAPQVMLLVFLCLASFETVAPIPAAMRALPEVLESAQRLFALLDRTPQRGLQGTAAPSFGAAASLEVTDLSFAYGDARPPILARFSLRLNAGERLLIVGPSGAGKSTLISLLTGLRVPTRGSIRVNGQDQSAVSPEAWRAAFAVAPQEVRLFAGTLRENLTLGAVQASEAEILAACRVARLEAFLERLPGGLNGMIGEAGSTVSGGEARRIGLARALLKPAPIVILDEPTEGLDPAMEQAFFQDLEAALGGRSLIVISHRSTRLAMIDRVLRFPVCEQ